MLFLCGCTILITCFSRQTSSISWLWMPWLLVLPVASFTKEVNSRLVKHPLVFNGHLANLGLNSLVKEAMGHQAVKINHSTTLQNVCHFVQASKLLWSCVVLSDTSPVPAHHNNSYGDKLRCAPLPFIGHKIVIAQSYLRNMIIFTAVFHASLIWNAGSFFSKFCFWKSWCCSKWCS